MIVYNEGMVYYSTSLTLYASEIDPSRNMFIEEIESYLSTLGKTSIDDFKRFTPSASVKVRVSSDGQMAVMPYLMGTWNYAKVVYEPDDGGASQTWYYFVSSIEMVADGTLSIGLELDHVNTFRNWVGAMTDRTFVRRALVSRYWDSRVHFDDMLAPEDVSGEIVKESESYFDADPVYMVFNSYDADIALFITDSLGLAVQDSFVAHPSIWSGYTSDPIRVAFILTGQGSKTIVFDYVNGLDQSVSKTLVTSEEVEIGFAYFTNMSGNGGTGPFVRTTSGALLWSDLKQTSTKSTGTITCTGSFSVRKGLISGATPASASSSGYSLLRTVSIDSIDRTSSNIVKIVELPYRPSSALGAFHFRSWINEGSGEGKPSCYYASDSVEPKFMRYLDVDLSSFDYAQKYPSTRDEAMPLDPKLKTGAFRYAKIVYDSYSTSLAFENFDPFAGASAKLKFAPSSSIASDSIFKVMGDFKFVKEDYPFLISSNRNNEIPIFNHDWIDYVRLGYNYDKKGNSMTILNSVMSMIGSIISSLTSVSTGKGGTAQAINAATSTAISMTSGITSIAGTINSQAAKESQLKNQSFSVSGINDLSLFKQYGNGCAKIEWWAPRADYEALLEHLFFYRGYSINRWMAPDTHAREWFDYLEATPSWNASFVKRTPPQFLNPLAAKVAEGVTIFHAVDDGSGAYAWDLAQEKGNNDL